MEKSVKNVKIYRNAIRLLIGAISIGSAFAIKHNNSENPVMISNGIYNSLAITGDLLDEGYYLYNDGDSIVDNEVLFGINEKNLESVKELQVYVGTTDFNDLKYMPNIESISFHNFGYLNNEQKAIISSLKNLKNVTITFSDDLYNEECYDMSWLNDNVNISLVGSSLGIWQNNEYNDQDVECMLIYNFINDLNALNNNRINVEASFAGNIDANDIERWNSRLTEIVDSFGFDENTTDEDKIIKIINYVTDYLDYNPEIKQALLSKDPNKEAEYKDYIMYYNDNTVGTALDTNNNYGVCANYATLTALLSYYSNLNLKRVSGTYNSNHAWCQYEKDGEVYIIDPTFLDGRKSFNELKENYNIDPSEANRLALLDSIFSDNPKYNTDQVYDYKLNDNGYNENITYVNKNADRYKEEQANKKKMEYSILAFSTLLAFATNEILNKKEEKRSKM